MSKKREQVPEPTTAGFGSRPVKQAEGVETPLPYDFASDVAIETWIAAGRPSLDDVSPSGATGEFTVADVRAVTEE